MTSYRSKLQITFALTAALACHVACSGSTPGDGGPQAVGGPSGPSSCGDSRRTGDTRCETGGLVCAAGSHCLTGTRPGCPTGCESDVNCGPSERCVKCGTGGAEIGSCRSCSDDPAKACGANTTPDGGGTCTRDTFFDQDCVAPGKAFSCPSTTEPTGQGTCAQAKLPGIWCCGGAVATCKRDTFIDKSECSHPGPTGARPPKGYACDSGSQPSDSKCVQGDISSHWCCPT